MLLDVGQSIPTIAVPDQKNQVRTLGELMGKKGVVLYFYPKDNTPGCTIEALDFQQLLPAFRQQGWEVVGISKDSPASHTSFCQKQGLQFTLLSDQDGALCTGFGVWQEKIRCGKTSMGIVRSTFVVEATGRILKVYANVTAKNHANSVLQDLS